MAGIETCVSTGEDEILDVDNDDTLNDCDEFPEEVQATSSHNRRKISFGCLNNAPTVFVGLPGLLLWHIGML
jgi:hypothetical protein